MVAIIGAGLTGLTAAFYLKRKGSESNLAELPLCALSVADVAHGLLIGPALFHGLHKPQAECLRALIRR